MKNYPMIINKVHIKIISMINKVLTKKNKMSHYNKIFNQIMIIYKLILKIKFLLKVN